MLFKLIPKSFSDLIHYNYYNSNFLNNCNKKDYFVNYKEYVIYISNLPWDSLPPQHIGQLFVLVRVPPMAHECTVLGSFSELAHTSCKNKEKSLKLK